MRSLFTLAIILGSFFASAQTISFSIKGTVADTKTAKFAYLSTLSQQVPISSAKVFLVAPIVDGNFELKGTFDLEGKPYQHACVFIDERGNISKEELASKFKALIWVTGRDKHLRNVLLEDMSLDIQEADQMITSNITTGGKLTKQLDEEGLAIRDGDRKMLDIIKKYPDSPISFARVKDLNDNIEPSNRDRLESRIGSPMELFVLLSERLRNSKEGTSLKKEIVEKDKVK